MVGLLILFKPEAQPSRLYKGRLATPNTNAFSMITGYNFDGAIDKTNFVMACIYEPIVTKTNGGWEIRFK